MGTAEDLQKHTRCWSLESDAKLLEFMQSIAQNLEGRAKNTNKKIQEMFSDLGETTIALENVTNELSALQHSQFVENRVYEDDETIANVSDVPTDVPDDKKQYDPIETINTVLKNSISMLDKCYQRVSIDLEDSDDEEGLTKSIVYKPKNKFEERPLPYLIGSKEWKEKWHIGLCDSDDEYSDDENKEEYSDTSENVSISTSLPSNAPTISESENSVWGLQTTSKRPATYLSSDEEISSNTVISKTSSEDVQRLQQKQIVIPPNLQQMQNERYYIHKPEKNDLFDDNSEDSDDGYLKSNFEKLLAAKLSTPQQQQQQQQQQKQQNPYKENVVNGISNIISDVPPEIDEVDRRDENENPPLFYESDEEVNQPKNAQNTDRSKEIVVSSNIRKKPVNLFDDDDFDSFMKELENKNRNNKENTVKNLFDDVNDDKQEEENVIIAPVSRVENTANKVESNKSNEIRTNLFDSEPEDNLFDNIIKKSKKTNTNNNNKNKSRNLFDDESSDDEFENIFKTSAKKSTLSSVSNDFETESKLQENPTNDNKINEETNNNIKVSSKPSIPFFFDKPLEENVENARPQPGDANKGTFQNNVINEGRNEVKSAAIKKIQDLFLDDADDDEDDMFSAKSPPPVAAPRGKTSEIDKGKVDNEKISSIKVNDPEDIPTSANKEEWNVNEPSIDTFTENETSATRNVTNLEAASKNVIEDVFTEIEKEHIKSKKNLSNIFFDDEPPDDDDDLFNISQKKSNKNLQNEEIIHEDHSINTENHDILSSINVPEATPTVTNKYKLPDLFNDDTIEDDDSTFSNSKIISSKSISSNNENLDDTKDTGTEDNLKSSEEEKLKSSSSNENIFNSSLSLAPETNAEGNGSTISESFSNNIPSNSDVLSDYRLPNNQSILIPSKDFDSSGNTTKDNQFLKNNTESIAKENPETNCDIDKNSASIFSTINIFQDIPPDDDFQITTTDSSKRLHNIFYDDIADTFPSTINNSSRKTAPNYFFSDEPPPDSFDDDNGIETNSEAKDKNATEINKELPQSEENSTQLNEKQNIDFNETETDNRSYCVGDLIKKAGTEQLSSKPKEPTTVPGKLKLNLDINVAALMPGAKRSSIKSDEGPIKSQTSMENYSKSTSPLSSSLFGSEQEDDKKEKATIVQEKQQFGKNNLNSDKLTSLNKTRAKIQVKRRPSSRRARQESYRKTLIENDSNTSNTETGTVNAIEAKNTVEPEFFIERNIIKDSDTSDSARKKSDLFTNVEQPTIKNDVLIKPIEIEKENVISEPNKMQFINSNDAGNDDDDDDDDLFANAINVPAKILPKVSQQKQKQSKSIFQDEFDDDNLFQKVQSSNVAEKIVKDAFKSPSPMLPQSPPLLQKQLPEKGNIFSSDEDDNDLFSKSIKVVKKSSGAFGNNPVKKLSVPQSKSLFGDDEDEDDDDLFGTATAIKPNLKASTSATATSVGAITKSVKRPDKITSKGSTTKDNPLADLLND